MLKFGRINTLNFVNHLDIISSDAPNCIGHIKQCYDLLKNMFENIHCVVGFAHEVKYQSRNYDFVLLSKYGEEVKVSLILLDEKYEWPLVFTDRMKTHNPLKNGISVLRIDYKHFFYMEKIILNFLEESSYNPIVKVSDLEKYSTIMNESSTMNRDFISKHNAFKTIEA